MTTLQKTFIAATVTILVGAVIYEAQHAGALQTRNEKLKTEQNAILEQNRQYQTERDRTVSRLSVLEAENTQLRATHRKVEQQLKVEQQFRQEVADSNDAGSSGADEETDPFAQSVLDLASKAGELHEKLMETPRNNIPEIQLLDESDWLAMAKTAKLGNPEDVRKSLAELRTKAKQKFPMTQALDSYAREHENRMPTDLSQLKPYFDPKYGTPRLDDATFNAIMARYALAPTGTVSPYQLFTPVVMEKAPIDSKWDSRVSFGNGTMTTYRGKGWGPNDRF